MGSPNIHVPAVRAILAGNVRVCLDELKWSESELARRSGVSQKQVNNVVRQRNGCSVEALHQLARALGVPNWLLLQPNLGRPVTDALKIPGTRSTRGAPHFTNYRRLLAYERATGLRVKGRHAPLVDWLLPSIGADQCADCNQLGVLCVDGQWRICPYCEGAVWRLTAGQRAWLRAAVGRRFPEALVRETAAHAVTSGPTESRQESWTTADRGKEIQRVEVLLRGEFSSMVSVWNEYLCLEIRDGRPWLSHRRYEALGEIHDFEVETDEGDCEYRIPDVIDGQAVVGTEDEWVVGGELMLDPADNASEIDLTISDTLAVRRWLEERGFDRQDGFDGVWMRIEGLLVSRPGGGTNDGQAS